MSVHLRSATLRDCSAIYEMVRELENKTFNKSDFEKIYAANLRDNSIHYVVAELDNRVVGFVSLHIQKLLHHNGSSAEIQELFVNNGLRGGGIGKQLMDRARHIANDRKCKVFEVACNIKRKNSRRFYEKEGLKRTHYKFTENLG